MIEEGQTCSKNPTTQPHFVTQSLQLQFAFANTWLEGARHASNRSSPLDEETEPVVDVVDDYGYA